MPLFSLQQLSRDVLHSCCPSFQKGTNGFETYTSSEPQKAQIVHKFVLSQAPMQTDRMHKSNASDLDPANV